MNLFTHGERVGKLTVLGHERNRLWKVACTCGHKFHATANQLLKARKTSCKRCACAKGAAI